jgi:hypothetical protein
VKLQCGLIYAGSTLVLPRLILMPYMLPAAPRGL